MTQKILLADDSVTIQKVIELTFMDEDYEVTTAGNGEEALVRLGEMTPDVVIADVHMPGASGFEVSKRSKQLHPGVPVLLLVGTFEPFDEGDYADSAADSYLKKPFDSQELLQRVSELLDSASSGASGAVADDETLGYKEAPAFEDASTGAGALGADEPVDYAAQATATLRPAVVEANDAGTGSVSGWASESPSGRTEGPQTGGGDPFPNLAAPAARASDNDIFRGLGEADGSSEVLPPPDLDAGWGDSGDGGTPFEVASDEELVVEEPAPLAEDDWAASAARADASESVSSEVTPAWGDAGAGTVAVSTAGWQTEAANVGADAAAVGDGLSEGDVDRIAHRVAEILGADAVREVAWEVVPDLAEVVIKDRLRELESQVD